MPHYPAHLLIGIILLLAVVAVHLITVNRVIKRKLRVSLFLAFGYLVLNLFLARATVPAEVEARWRSVEELLLALAVINLLVVATLNPLRADRISDRFPNIVQDAIIVGLFLVLATVVMREKFLTTSAVGAVVVGFALQDTLGNAFAGLAIQIEKPFHIGHWVTVGGFEGRVSEITWRATKLRTKTGNFVVVPNNVISKEAITNYSEPALPSRIEVDVGASYLTPPNEVKAAIRSAIAGAQLVLKSPAPDVILWEFGNSAIVYRARFWISDFEADDLARDQVRSGIYYAFHRQGIEIPWPIQVEYQREEKPAQMPERRQELARILGGINVFAPFSETQRQDLVASSHERLYGEGEVIARQGEPGNSMFVVASGRARVQIEPSGREVATVEPGGYFGEMSLLTGEPRTATVIASSDSSLLEITADTFRRIVSSYPDVVEHIGVAMEGRRKELEELKLASVSTVATRESPEGFLDRVRRFLHL